MSAKIDKKQARRAFSRHGGGGDLFAEIARRLAARLDEIGIEPKWIVDIGGDGEKMAARYPNARVLAADFAAPRLRRRPRVYPAVADAEHLPAGDSTADLVWSNLCLEWTDMQKSLAEAARVLRPKTGLFVFSTLGRDTLREARAVFGGRVHEFMDMHDIGDMLSGFGFAETVLETEHLTLTYRAPADALREVHAAGCGFALTSRSRGLTGRRAWELSLAEYGRRFCQADGKIAATYEIIYAAAWRKPPPTLEKTVHIVRREIAAKTP